MLEGVSRGRCFVKKDEPTGAHKVAAKAEAKLVKIKVTRANGSVEEIDLDG